jgi:hypothetical protein
VIDFRYHLVSIVAVFLALALGIILGSTTLSQSVTAELKKQASDAARNSQQLRQEQRRLEAQRDGEEQFAKTLGADLVADRLKGQSVVFVETPGASNDSIEQLSELAKSAGATVTGRVTIQKKFLDDDQVGTVDELAGQLRPEGVTVPEGGGPYDRAGAVLASALVTRDTARSGREDAGGGAVLNGFRQAGYLTTTGRPGQHATLAVMIAPSTPYQYDGGEIDNRALLSLAAALDGAGRGVVVGGPSTSAQEGGLIAALRDSDVRKQVSATDMVDTSSGRVVAVLALQNEIAGKSGQYGTGSGVDGYLPSPVPTASKSG